MQLTTANRQNLKIKMAIEGPGGAGKTFSALLLAFGLCGDWSKIALIDTMNTASQLYAHFGPFKVIDLGPPFTTERYIQAIQACEDQRPEVIIIDSISDEWDGIGGILETHRKMTGNAYTNWAKLSPNHTLFVQKILHSASHTIATIRSKPEYILTEKNGKQIPEKIGFKTITRSGLENEFFLVFELALNHAATCIIDRTGLYLEQVAFSVTVETGKKIRDWCNEKIVSIRIPTTEEILQRVNSCETLEELLDLYNLHPDQQKDLQQDFTKRRNNLLTQMNNSKPITQQQKLSTNGTATIT